MGASCVGVDLSDQAITKAKELNEQLDLGCEFIESDVYDLGNHLSGEFDIVFSSYGTITWLPDMDKWAEIVKKFLKHDSGKLHLIEFHPYIWMWDEAFEKISYPYFNTGAFKEQVKGTYAEPSAPIQAENVFWNHALSEVFGSLLNADFNIVDFREYKHSPYNVLDNMHKHNEWVYRHEELKDKIPYVYSIEALVKNDNKR